MAFKIDIEDEAGQITSHWVIEMVRHIVRDNRREVTVLGYKSKAAKLAGKRPLIVTVTLESGASNMSLNEIEAAVMLDAKFTGAVAE